MAKKTHVTLIYNRTIKRDFAMGKLSYTDGTDSGELGYLMESTPRPRHNHGNNDPFGKTKKFKTHDGDPSLLIPPGIYDLEQKNHGDYKDYYSYSPSENLLVKTEEVGNHPEITDFQIHEIFQIKIQGNRLINILWDISGDGEFNSVIFGDIKDRESLENLEDKYLELYQFLMGYENWTIEVDQ